MFKIYIVRARKNDWTYFSISKISLVDKFTLMIENYGFFTVLVLDALLCQVKSYCYLRDFRE